MNPDSGFDYYAAEIAQGMLFGLKNPDRSNKLAYNWYQNVIWRAGLNHGGSTGNNITALRGRTAGY